MNCQEAIDVMGDAVESGLDPGLRAGFETHIGECTPCRNYFEHLRFTRRALSRLPRGQEKSPQREALIEQFLRELGRRTDESTH